MGFLMDNIPILILLCVIVAGLYLIPSIIAVKKNHLDTTAIIIINIFLGWSFVGWVVALVWSVKEPSATIVKQQPIVYLNPDGTPFNPKNENNGSDSTK